ncbi:MAG: InlB B-repeat-containing protein, partial [Planctomycetia bacterium]|nr:InlB B-repeat-containing protein [Planctomycetia bacterium]
MYMMKKSLAVLLVLLLVLGMFALPAYAAETSLDGLAVTLTTDKKEYARSETIAATLTVKNTNTVAVKDVTLESMIPAGYVLAEGDKTALHVDTLAAGQTITLTVHLVPQQSQEPTTNGNTPPKGDDPGTGDPFPMELLVVVLVLAMIGLGLLVVKYKAWKRVLSLVLCAAMLVSLVAGVPFEVFAAGDDTKTIDISTTVKAGGQPVNIKATVKYAPVPSGGTDEGGSGGSTTTYHKITFANPAQEQYAPDTLPESCTLAKNTLVYTLTEPEQDGYVFCGWYYDSNLTQVAATTDTVTSDLTLYPKMVERQGDPYVTGVGSLNYVSSLNVDTDFTVQVQAQSEQQIRDSLTFLEVSNFDAEVEYTVTAEGDGIYTLTPVNGLNPGSSYQIAATDRDADP